jgi:hypothetical protein
VTISFLLIWSQYIMNSTNYEVLHYYSYYPLVNSFLSLSSPNILLHVPTSHALNVHTRYVKHMTEVKVEVTLWLTVSLSVCLGIEYPCGTCGQILFPVRMLLSEICGLVSVGQPLWREDGSVICSVITQWSKSLRTRNHILLSYLRLPQPGGPGSLIYIPQEQSGPVIPH